MDFTIRAATLEDCKDIARMILELAEYEKVSDQVKITQRDLEQDGFSKNPFFHGIIAEVPEQHRTKEGHSKVGYALYFFSYSSWKGRAVYMEDLYVMPEFRGKGIGKALMSKVAQVRETAHRGNVLVVYFHAMMLCYHCSFMLASGCMYYYVCVCLFVYVEENLFVLPAQFCRICPEAFAYTISFFYGNTINP
ncbi:diamine acetyltransferase 1-like isoform X1 [Hypomesus transpacificus]|uniref:diamine acetyltransferase 1-like isoform X1 n=1 Tax=Hypomesus transpacificus TaxID=137520 RepID=UPI001F086194|nr:diamine acetyltransferase 1-like isoform X1 [Hypomesus transpacificus]